jgi:hypothetical protein
MQAVRNEKPRWSADREPKYVLATFCQEFEGAWRSLNANDWAAVQAEEVADEALYLAIEHIRRTLVLLEDLVLSAAKYVNQYMLSHMSPQSELSALVDVSIDLQVAVSGAKGFCDLLLQDEANGEKAQDRRFLGDYLRRIDYLVREIFPLMVAY